MKMYKGPGHFIAEDERGRVAPCAADILAAHVMWTEPETFLRMAHVYSWMAEWPGYLPRRDDLELLWERPDPHFTCWDCGRMLIVTDGHGNYAPIEVAHKADDLWRDATSFVLRNAAGAVAWTGQEPGADAEEARYAATIAEHGEKLWEVPETK